VHAESLDHTMPAAAATAASAAVPAAAPAAATEKSAEMAAEKAAEKLAEKAAEETANLNKAAKMAAEKAAEGKNAKQEISKDLLVCVNNTAACEDEIEKWKLQVHRLDLEWKKIELRNEKLGGVGRFSKGVTSFFLSLKNAVLDAENVLTLYVDASIARSMGLYTQNKDGNTLILIRDDYKALWDKISFSRGLNFANTHHAVVNGTAGIGKSTFRWYLVWRWLNSDLEIAFEDIRVNSSGAYYIIEIDGAVRQVQAEDLLFEASKSLALLDPCSLVQDKNVVFSMAIVTASPSSILGQLGKISLSEFMKNALVYVLKLWTLEEIKKVIPEINPELLRKFSFQSGEETYCVPRWLTYSPSTIPGHVAGCWTNSSQEALRNFFLSKGDDGHKSQELPYRLCNIVENGENDWKVEGFISEYAASLVYDWAEIGANLTRENFGSLLNHPLGGGLIGNWYERWALSSIASGVPVIVSNALLSGEITEQTGNPNMRKFYFDALEDVDIDLPRTRQAGKRVPKPAAFMVRGVLYHPMCKIYPSIDAFGITNSGELILLQFTKALQHYPANWEGISNVVTKTGKESKVILIYCTPDVDQFRTPNCTTLDACPTGHKVTVCKGSVGSEFFFQLKKSCSIEQMLSLPSA